MGTGNGCKYFVNRIVCDMAEKQKIKKMKMVSPSGQKQKAEKKSPLNGSSVGGAALREWEQMVVNPGGFQAVRTPSMSPFTGAVRTFTRVLTIPSKGVNSAFDFTLRPKLFETLSVMNTNVLALPATWKFDGHKALLVDPNTKLNGIPCVGGGMTIYNTALNPNTVLGEMESTYDPIGKVIYFPISHLNIATSTSIKISQCNAQFWHLYYLTGGGVWTYVNRQFIEQSLTLVGVVAVGIAILLDGGTNVPRIEMTPLVGPVPQIASANIGALFDTQAVDLSKVSTYRVTAMSALTTYSGNMFNDGGVLACARTRADHLYEDAAYTSLSKLVDHAYHGSMKDGCYAWWLPYSLEEMEFVPPRSDLWDTELKVAGIFTDAAGQVQVTVTAVVEFYSPLQIFEHNIGPPLTDEFIRAYHALDRLPACTCNPLHTEILQGIVSGLKKGARATGSFLLDNPQVLLKILSAMMV